MIFLLIGCLAHKTDLTGIVDHVGKLTCTVEMSTGEVIVLKSNLCKSIKEGDIIHFYTRKK